MSDCHKFQDVKKQFTLSVKSEFLTKCPNPEEFNTYDLNNKYYMFKFLHNPSGPAIIRHKDERKEYWIEGICLNKEDPETANKMEFDYNFGNKIDSIVND